MGAVATIFLLIGIVTLGVAALSALNTAFDWHLALGSYGSQTPLPDNWESVIGLGAAAALIIALTYFGSTVAAMFSNAKGKPLVRVGIVVAALVLLALAGRGLQVVALTSTYGSMLAYYCTDVGTLEDVQGELADDPTPEALDRCISRTAQWDRADLLEPVIAAGGNFMDATNDEEYRRCVIGSDVSVEYIETAIALGATPQTCPNSTSLIADKVDRAQAADDDETAQIVTLLLAAGWSAEEPNEFTKKTAAKVAARKNLTKTLAALAGG